MSYIYKFTDRTITEYTIKADSEKAALDTIDSMWWKKQMTMQENMRILVDQLVECCAYACTPVEDNINHLKKT